MYFGDWEGLTYAEIQPSQPEPEGLEADLLVIARQVGNLRQMGMRVSEFLDEIMLAHPGETVMLVAHGGTFEALAMVHLGFKTEKVWQLRMSNTGISEFSCYPAGATLDRWNDTGHLEV
jgi:broad specificity phosphatase PhoE